MKTLFTHAIVAAENDQTTNLEVVRINALQIAARFLAPSKKRNRIDYYD